MIFFFVSHTYLIFPLLLVELAHCCFLFLPNKAAKTTTESLLVSLKTASDAVASPAAAFEVVELKVLPHEITLPAKPSIH